MTKKKTIELDTPYTIRARFVARVPRPRLIRIQGHRRLDALGCYWPPLWLDRWPRRLRRWLAGDRRLTKKMDRVKVAGWCLGGDCDCQTKDGQSPGIVGWPPYHDLCTCCVVNEGA